MNRSSIFVVVALLGTLFASTEAVCSDRHSIPTDEEIKRRTGWTGFFFGSFMSPGAAVVGSAQAAVAPEVFSRALRMNASSARTAACEEWPRCVAAGLESFEKDFVHHQTRERLTPAYDPSVNMVLGGFKRPERERLSDFVMRRADESSSGAASMMSRTRTLVTDAVQRSNDMRRRVSGTLGLLGHGVREATASNPGVVALNDVKRQPELTPCRHEELTPSLVDVVM